jgi:hypothetical protein
MLKGGDGWDGDVRDCLTSPGFRAPCAKVARRATMRRRRMFFIFAVAV